SPSWKGSLLSRRKRSTRRLRKKRKRPSRSRQKRKKKMRKLFRIPLRMKRIKQRKAAVSPQKKVIT
ncbi:MAG TPA: hypothetical protein H9914_15020, partial [Candidatus Blautia avicola]|nr:hypothetical protein [Candidatus Blautia avicola]